MATTTYEDNSVCCCEKYFSHPLLSASEERSLIKLTKQGDIEARNTLIESNTRLLADIANRYVWSGLELWELIHEGMFGLVKAIYKFDFNYDVRLSTFATWSIHGCILKAVKDHSRVIKAPFKVIFFEDMIDGSDSQPWDNFVANNCTEIERMYDALDNINCVFILVSCSPNISKKYFQMFKMRYGFCVNGHMKTVEQAEIGRHFDMSNKGVSFALKKIWRIVNESGIVMNDRLFQQQIEYALKVGAFYYFEGSLN